jgi:hypothetical protein
MKRWDRIIVAAAAISAGFLVGCQHAEVNDFAAPPGSSVRIVHISPPVSSIVRVGDRLSVVVEAEYSLTVDSGVVRLVIQGSDIFPIAQDTQVVTRGAGKVTLKAEAVVPDTKAIQVFTPLSARGQGTTTTVDHRVYKVLPMEFPGH